MSDQQQYWLEGPHICFNQEGNIEMHYLSGAAERIYQQPAVAHEKLMWLQGQEQDYDQLFPLTPVLAPAPVEQENIARILILGDQHGHYHKLLKFLKAQQVIDTEENWSWGTGHLVFCGDLMDRGLEVLPLLWLVHRLEQQAALAGGAVHVLLGNHEQLVMQGDYRYVHPELQDLYHRTGREYNTYFQNSWYLGRWLRSRNTVIKLNKLLISHAGISPHIAKARFALEEIDQIMRAWWQNGTSAASTQQLLSAQGPLWYRGYVMQQLSYNPASEQEASQVLLQYDANAMVVAHTPVPQIRSLLGGKVWAVDLDIESAAIAVAGLLVEGDRFYELSTEGGCQQVH